MSSEIEIKAPVFPESVESGVVSLWHRNEGEMVQRDEPVADIETDKVQMELLAPADGRLKKIIAPVGSEILSGAVIALLEQNLMEAVADESPPVTPTLPLKELPPMSVAVRRLLAENDVDAREIPATGRRGRLTATDVRNWLNSQSAESSAVPTEAAGVPESDSAETEQGRRSERREPMSRLRSRIAERMLQVSQQTAMLTTFNEIDMSAVNALRHDARSEFEARHGVKLGLMSFFAAAIAEACCRWPVLNASIDGDTIVYHGYLDLGVAVSTDRGLVVPVLRDADRMSLAEIESGIRDYAQKARSGKLDLDDLQGGTFTLTNGGVFGSLLSTPLLNPPQVGIVGLHKTEQRAVVVDGRVEVRPMMYVALSYDHRLVDGREAVGFLLELKKVIEQPARLLLGLQDTEHDG